MYSKIHTVKIYNKPFYNPCFRFLYSETRTPLDLAKTLPMPTNHFREKLGIDTEVLYVFIYFLHY